MLVSVGNINLQNFRHYPKYGWYKGPLLVDRLSTLAETATTAALGLLVWIVRCTPIAIIQIAIDEYGDGRE
jgi:hypothetical protein